ncbi:MAG: RICIN domain-containing protein [Verrucomicrobiota bacterium]
MPIGDSITSGFQSSSDNGYRGALYNALVAQGHQTDFVGAVRDGTTFDPDHEGHSGYRIDQVASLLNGALSAYQPNIVTLHIGSNDMNQNYQVSSAPNRLASMIDQILAAVPGVTVVVAQLVPNSDANVQSRINSYNSQIPGIVQSRANAGKRVLMINMNSLNTGDLKDGLHPNDGGYQKMAGAWQAGIQQVIANGWVTSLAFAGTYQLQCVSSGQSLDVAGGSAANGAAVVQWPYTGGRNQLWNFIPTSGGYYQIKSANSGLDLNVSGGSTSNGALVVQWPYGSGNNDQWLPSRNADGTHTFHNRNSGLVLDNPGGGTQAAQFLQWGANGGANQKFNCIPR